MHVDRTRLYRVKAVAEMVDVSLSTIYREVERGALDVVRVGKAVRVPGSALDRWLRACGYAEVLSGQDAAQNVQLVGGAEAAR